MFQWFLKYFKVLNCNTAESFRWAFNGLSEESITTPTTPGNGLTPRLNYIKNAKMLVKIYGNCSN